MNSLTPLELTTKNQYIINAFIEGTPGAFQTDMREGLKKHGLLDK